MRYSKDHKEKTRQRLIGTAAASIRRNGVAGSGVIGLAAEMGLTQGALYRHFPSKDQLIEAAAVEAVQQMLAKLTVVISSARSEGTTPIDAIIDWYLDLSHWEAVADGCLMSALGGELARQPEGLRRATMSLTAEAVDMIAAELPCGGGDKAMALYALMIGTLQLARISVSTEERDRILAVGRKSASALAQV